MVFPSTLLATTLGTAVVALLMAKPALALDGASSPTLMGCYNSSQALKFQATDTFQSSGACQKSCVPLNKPVMAMTGEKECWCGDNMPPLSSKVDDAYCTSSCP